MISKVAETVTAAWNRFFFEPTSTATIGVFRICIGIVVFISLLGTFPYRALFYSDAGIVSYATMSHFLSATPSCSSAGFPLQTRR